MTSHDDDKGGQKGTEEIILPLEVTVTKLTKANSIVLKMRVNPGSANSPTFEKPVRVLDGSEDVRAAIDFRRGIVALYTGMGCNDYAKKDRLVSRLLKDNAYSTYEVARNEHHELRWTSARIVAKRTAADNGDDEAAQQAAYDNEADPGGHADDISQGINAVVEFMSPYKVLSRVKRQMRRKIRKPLGMSIRVFFTNFIRINDEELPNLPPAYNIDQSLKDDELSDIMIHAVPSSWRKKLIEQHKDYDTMKPYALMREFEKYEATEEKPKAKAKEDKSHANKKNKSSNSQVARAPTNDRQSGSRKKFCAYHGANQTHNTDECLVVKAMIESAKESKQKNPNKTWNRKDSTKNKQELKAMVAESVKETFQEMNALSKKRKANDELQAFDYSDFEKMAVSEETEA